MSHAVAPHYARAEAPREMRDAATPFEERFGAEFDTLTYFSKPLLEVLQTSDSPRTVPESVDVASFRSPGVVKDIEAMTEVANLDNPTDADRSEYRNSLLRIYDSLPVSAPQKASDDVLCVGPEREGRELAEMLGALPDGRSMTPSAKRITYDGGILVGISGVPDGPAPAECLVIDGVVASGATMMALMQSLPASLERATLLTAHSTEAGVWAIHRYARLLDIKLQIMVGHVSGVLNEHFYATDTRDPDRVLLGDVGDTISGLPHPMPTGD